MLANNFISDSELISASESELPKKPKFSAEKNSSYFLDAIHKQIQNLNLPEENGLKIYTSISPLRQIHAQKMIRAHLKKIEETKKIKLQASLINVDIKTGHIRALIGGSGYNQTQFNRPLSAKRQVGSLMKPFVYIAALENKDENGNPYNACLLYTSPSPRDRG